MTEQIAGYEPGNGDQYAFFLERAYVRQFDLDVAAVNLAAGTISEFDIEILKAEIKEELRIICPFISEEVCISGMAVVGESQIIGDDEEDYDGFSLNVAVMERDPAKKTIYARINGAAGLYRSPLIHEYKDAQGKQFRICHGVVIGGDTDELDDETVLRHDMYQAKFDLNSTIQLVKDVDDVFASLSLDPEQDQISILDQHSVELVTLINSRTFHRLTYQEQMQIIKDLIDAAEAKSGIREKHITIAFDTFIEGPTQRTARKNPRHLYVPEIRDGISYLRRRGDIPEVLGGVCIGVDYLDLHYSQWPVRKANQLKHRRSGLSLVVDLEPELLDQLDIDPRSAVYVPILGQNFNAELDNVD